MIIDKKKMGEFLAEKRIEAGISQIELARAIGYSSPQYVSNWERSICGPPLEKLYDICKLLKLDTNKIMEMIMHDTREYLSAELKLGKKARKKA